MSRSDSPCLGTESNSAASVQAHASGLKILAIACLSLLVARLALRHAFSGIVLQWLQLAAFPIIGWIVWKRSWIYFGLARWVFALATLGGAIAVGIGFWGHTSDSTPRVIVSRLSDDSDETRSRIVREALKARASENALSLAFSRYFTAFTSHAEAKEVFTQDNPPRAVVWGVNRWVFVTLPGGPGRRLSEWPNAPLSARLKRLTLVENTPIVGMSSEPIFGTSRFIALVLGALEENDPDRREALLRYAALNIENWTTGSHRAWPLLLLGNESVFRYLDTGARDAGLLACAMRDFNTAEAFLRHGENPALLAAVRNNRGVTRALMAEASGDRFRESLADFINGAKLSVLRDPYRAGIPASQVARKNLHALEEQRSPKVSKGNHGRKKHAR